MGRNLQGYNNQVGGGGEGTGFVPEGIYFANAYDIKPRLFQGVTRKMPTLPYSGYMFEVGTLVNGKECYIEQVETFSDGTTRTKWHQVYCGDVTIENAGFPSLWYSTSGPTNAYSGYYDIRGKYTTGKIPYPCVMGFDIAGFVIGGPTGVVKTEKPENAYILEGSELIMNAYSDDNLTSPRIWAGPVWDIIRDFLVLNPVAPQNFEGGASVKFNGRYVGFGSQASNVSRNAVIDFDGEVHDSTVNLAWENLSGSGGFTDAAQFGFNATYFDIPDKYLFSPTTFMIWCGTTLGNWFYISPTGGQVPSKLSNDIIVYPNGPVGRMLTYNSLQPTRFYPYQTSKYPESYVVKYTTEQPTRYLDAGYARMLPRGGNFEYPTLFWYTITTRLTDFSKEAYPWA